jgi:hypothetical protein
MVLSALIASLVRAQVSEQQQRLRERSLRMLQEESDSSSGAGESPTPRPKSSKPKAKKTPSPTPHKSPTPKSKAKKKASPEDEDATPKPKSHKKGTPEEDSSEATPKPKKKGKGAKDVSSSKKKGTVKAKESPKKAEALDDESSPAPKPSETPGVRTAAPVQKATAVATPAGPPHPMSSQPDTASDDSAQLTIEKTGYEKKPGFWHRFFHGSEGSSSGSGAGYRYLTRAVRAEIDRAPADRRNPRWQFIVVHNSGTRQGNARVFDYYHKHVRHMQNGLAYHFVIGNGTSTGNGQIEIGDRWRRQINGGHVHSDNLNNIALGICLVGDFNRGQPSPAQLQSCEELIRYLRQRCGKIGNHYMVVKPHREMNPPRWATDCPGDAFPYSWFRRFQE